MNDLVYVKAGIKAIENFTNDEIEEILDKATNSPSHPSAVSSGHVLETLFRCLKYFCYLGL